VCSRTARSVWRILSRHKKRLVGFTNCSVWCDVLFGRESSSFKLEDKHRLRAFENRILRKLFGRKLGQVTAECRKPSDEESRDLCSPPNDVIIIIIKSIVPSGT
jgi:hypothetical protein